MRVMGLTSGTKVKPLSEDIAADLGAEILGESLVFMVGVGTLFFEYRRGQRKEEKKEEEQNEQLSQMQVQLQELELTVATQSTQIRELTRLVHDTSSKQEKHHTDS